MHFSNEAEAFLAVASLVMSADQVSSAPEREHLFDHVGAMQPFRDLDTGQFKGMMATVNTQLFASETALHDLMKPDGMSKFCTAVKGALPGDKIETALHMACEIAYTDGILRVERSMLERLASGLGLTKDSFEKLLQNYDAKNAY